MNNSINDQLVEHSNNVVAIADCLNHIMTPTLHGDNLLIQVMIRKMILKNKEYNQ